MPSLEKKDYNGEKFSQEFFAQHPEKTPTGPTAKTEVDPAELSKNVSSHNKALNEKFNNWYQRIQNGHK